MPGPRNRPGPGTAPASGSSTATPTFAASAPSSHSGWANLRWTVNNSIPGALREIQRVNLATKFALIRAYRIR